MSKNDRIDEFLSKNQEMMEKGIDRSDHAKGIHDCHYCINSKVLKPCNIGLCAAFKAKFKKNEAKRVNRLKISKDNILFD